MKYPIVISKDVKLPVDVVTQTIAILAKRRAGKSYTMRRFSEQLLKADQQIVMIDPKGDQWGIRSSADGKKDGFPIIILGGEHGDLPLEVNAGEVVAKLVVEERVSVLLDLSSFRKGEVATFMAIFLENLYRMKAIEKNRTPVMVVADEADAIAPQKPQANEARMLGAIEDIVRRGGQRGIGCALITQRSAVLNKNVLTQAEILVVLRTIAPQDLNAMKEWIHVHGSLEEGKELMDSLPSLPIGDAWFWSPGWPTAKGIFKRTHVLPIETFDSGATPKAGERKIVPKKAADVNLKALEKAMADTIEKKKAEDPKELKKRIVELEGELRKKGTDPESVKSAVDVALLQREREYEKERNEMIRISGLYITSLKQIAKSAAEALKIAGKKTAKLYFVSDDKKVLARTLEGAGPGEIIKMPNRPVVMQSADPGSLQSGELAILKAIAQVGSGINRPHLTALTGYKKSTRDRYIVTLKSRGYVEQSHEAKLYATQEGMAALGPDFEPLPTGAALRDHLLNTLPEGERKIFAALVDAYADGLTRDEITDKTGYQKSTRDRYLLYLKAKELIDTSQPGFVICQDHLFK